MSRSPEWFTSHLGAHGKGECLGHRLDTPRDGLVSMALPWVPFRAMSRENAEKFVGKVNAIADKFKMDGLDLANIVGAADTLFDV